MKRNFEEEGDLEVWLDRGRNNRPWGCVFQTFAVVEMGGIIELSVRDHRAERQTERIRREKRRNWGGLLGKMRIRDDGLLEATARRRKRGIRAQCRWGDVKSE